MSTRNLLLRNKFKHSSKLNESQEIDEIIDQQKKLQKSELQNNLNISVDKSLDWLNFFFADNEIKTLYNNFERIRAILVIQGIFYLNLYKNIINYKQKFCLASPNVREKDDNMKNILNHINLKIKSLPPLDDLPVIKSHNSIVMNNLSCDEHDFNNNDISQIHHINEFVEIKNPKFEEIKSFRQLPSLNNKLFSYNETNNKSMGFINKDLKKNTLLKKNKNQNAFNLPNSNIFNIGIIGCGCLGELMAKYLIKIKDEKLMNFKLIISTRRPNKVDEDIRNSIDENIEIILDNEKVVEECDVIFLCIQPHQLDLLIKEIFQPLNDRLEKLRRKKAKIFPTLISFLAGITYERLKTLLPEDLNIIRTLVFPKIISKYDEINQSGINNPTESIKDKQNKSNLNNSNHIKIEYFNVNNVNAHANGNKNRENNSTDANKNPKYNLNINKNNNNNSNVNNTNTNIQKKGKDKGEGNK